MVIFGVSSKESIIYLGSPSTALPVDEFGKSEEESKAIPSSPGKALSIPELDRMFTPDK